MESYKLDSNSISVFPTTKRTAGNRSSKLLSEANLVNIVNMLLDREAFVISNFGSLDLTLENNVFSTVNGINVPLEFNICGYYFKVNSVTELLNTLELNMSRTNSIDIYANINIISVGGVPELYGTDNIDVEDNDIVKYDGVVFTKVNPIYSKNLKILTVTQDINSTKCKIPIESLVKFESRSIGNLDCGEI